MILPIKTNACFAYRGEEFFGPNYSYSDVLIHVWNGARGTLYVRFLDGRVTATLFREDTTSWFEKLMAWVGGKLP